MSAWSFRDSGALISWGYNAHLPRGWRLSFMFRLPRHGYSFKLRTKVWNAHDYVEVP